MTSKAHGYGVEEAITSSEGSGGGDDGGSHAKSHMNGTVANSCQMLLCLSRHHCDFVRSLDSADYGLVQ